MNNLSRFIRPLAFAVVGLFVLGGVGLVYANSKKDDNTYTVTAYFTKAIGLFEKSDVNILGVPVGKVTSVEPVGTRVKVEMVIDDQYKIEKSDETFAQIVPISVISDRYIQLGPVCQNCSEALAHGDVLDTDITQIPAELDDVFKQLKKLLDAIEPGKEGEPGALGDLIVQLNRTLEDRERDLQGTLVSGAQLTGTLSDADEDIAGLLVNLDSLFGKLSKKTNAMTELNTNFALVMTALAQSRQDLEGTLTNLAHLTDEVGKLATKHGDRLGKDLELATHITTAVLENRASVEESLTWLPVVGRGVTAAYHPPPISAIDVRDNANAKLECEFLDDLPPGPIKDELREICRGQTGEPPPMPQPLEGGRENPEKLDCDKGVRKVKRQLRRIERVDVPQAALDEILRPLRKKLRELKKECKELGEVIDDPSGILENPPVVPGLPDLDQDVTELSGSAAGTHAVGSDQDGAWESVADWLGGLFSFVGVRS